MTPQKQVEIERFYYVACLSNVMPNAVSISLNHVTTSANTFNAMPTSYAFSCDFVFVHLQPAFYNIA